MRSCGPFNHRVNGLQVAWIWQQFEFNGLPTIGIIIAGGSQMVLHIPRSLNTCRINITLKISKHFVIRLVHHIHQNVQPSAVSHSQIKFIDIKLTCPFHQKVHHGNQGISSLQ